MTEPLLASRNVELVEMTCRPTGGGLALKFLVDTARGVSVGDLSALNRAIGAVLDEHDAVPERYTLEVSSPGLDRPLRSGRDFERVIGRRVRVLTSVPVNDRQEHRGDVLGASDEAVTLKADSGEKVLIPLSQITHAAQEIKF
ncbi:MAG: ribosome maturation factor RimP [Candidatus Omnitrophica bacterium]|nr:ribosome maturation factor RimP [Candidatus Omnitrophota bacterium]